MTSNPTSSWRVAIIGAGVSGLSAAHRLIELSAKSEHPMELILFEAGSRVGGSIQTKSIGKYLVETGADMFVTDKIWAKSLCERLGLQDRLISTDEHYRRSLVLRKGKPVPVPEGFILLSMASMWSVLTSPIFSPWAKLRLAAEYFVPRRMTEGDESVASFVRRRLGREVLDRLVQALVGGIYTADPEKLSLRATMPRFLEMEREYGSLIRASRRRANQQPHLAIQGSGARYELFMTLQGGVSELIEALSQRVTKSATIRFNEPISTLTSNAVTGRYQLRPNSGLIEEFDAVVVALPSYQAAELLSGSGAPNQQPTASSAAPLGDLLRKIEYSSTAVVASGHKLIDVRHPLNAFGLVIPTIENRQILAVSFASRKFSGRAPNDGVQLRTFVGGAMQPELLDKTDDEILAIVRHELADTLGVSGHEEFAIVTRHRHSMPQYHTGHIELIQQIEKQLSIHPGLALAGNAYHGVGIPDCIHSGEKAAAQLLATRLQIETSSLQSSSSS